MGGDGQALRHRGLKSSSLRFRDVQAVVELWSCLSMGMELTMKDLSQVLRQKEMDIERVRKEIKALHFVIPLLAEDADRFEPGLAAFRLAVGRDRDYRRERAATKRTRTATLIACLLLHFVDAKLEPSAVEPH